MSTTRMPVSPLIENTPPMAIVISADKIGADRLERKADVDLGAPIRARRRPSGKRRRVGRLQRPDVDAPGRRTRAFSSSVSPGSATKVPVDWSLAIFAASASGSPAVSMR